MIAANRIRRATLRTRTQRAAAVDHAGPHVDNATVLVADLRP